MYNAKSLLRAERRRREASSLDPRRLKRLVVRVDRRLRKKVSYYDVVNKQRYESEEALVLQLY